jgi:hypothetical protein
MPAHNNKPIQPADSPALEGEVVPEGIDQLIKLEAEYDRLSDDALSNRWDAARLYVEELAKPGMTQEKLADLVSKDQSHVSRMAKVWREHGDDYDLGHNRPPFNPLYQAAKKSIEAAEKRAQKFIDEQHEPYSVLKLPQKKPGRSPLDKYAGSNSSALLDKWAQPDPGVGKCGCGCAYCCNG